MNRIAKGRSSEIFLLENDHILKLFYENRGFMRDLECRIISIASSHGIPVPRFVKKVERDNRHGIVYILEKGTSMLNAAINHPKKIPFLARTLADLHRSMHEIEIVGLSSFKAALENHIRSSKYLTKEQKKSAYHKIQKLPEGNNLCHGDLHLNNVLITNEGPLILDWALAIKGDPLADVFITSYYLSLNSFSKSEFKKIYLEEYLKYHAKRTLKDVEAWRIPILAALTNFCLPQFRRKIISDLEETLG